MAQPKAQQTFFADIGNRAGAILLDLMLVTSVVSTVSGTALSAPIAILSVALLYVWGMPLSPLQGTLGKWIAESSSATGSVSA